MHAGRLFAVVQHDCTIYNCRLVLGDTENFFLDNYREKVSQYWKYHDTCFASGVIGVKESGGGQLREQLPPGAVQQARGHTNFTKIF